MTIGTSLKARLERLGPVRDVPRVTSGSPVLMILGPARKLRDVKAVSASLAIAKRGLSLLQAKRAIEKMLDKGSVVLALQLPFCFEVRALSGSLVSSTPE